MIFGRIFKEIYNSLKRNLILVMLIVGALFTVTGMLLPFHAENLPISIVNGIANTGAAIIGGGVFAAILKSAQFVEIFQEHIFNAVHDPEAVGTARLREKWLALSEKLLSSTLPVRYQDAAAHILEQFFDDELEYHFADYEVCYEIDVVDSQRANILHTTKGTIVLSRKHENPCFTQTLWSRENTSMELVSLFVNGNKIEHSNSLEKSSKSDNSWLFELNLGEFAHVNEENGDRTVKFERTYRVIQNIGMEPEIMGTVQRYTRGMTIKARVLGEISNSGPYSLQFDRFGITGKAATAETGSAEDGEGFTRWVLAGHEEVLLPGQGYTILLRAPQPEIHTIQGGI